MANKPSHNLLEDGIDKCADYIMRAISKKSVPFRVFVDPKGWLRVRTLVNYKPFEMEDRPQSEWVGIYQKKSVIDDYVRKDLADRLEELQGCAMSKAA